MCFDYVYSGDIATMNLACQFDGNCRNSSFGESLFILCILGFIFACFKAIMANENDNYRKTYRRYN